MPTLPTQSFQTIVANVVAGIQGRSSKLINFAIGSTLRAIAEGFAGLFLWLQAMVLQLLTATRLATSSNSDVDTFVGDFGMTRLGAEAATGQVTYGRLTAGPSTCFIPAASAVSATGAITNAGPNKAATLQTSDGSQNFVVVVDTTNTAYSATLGGYTLPAFVSAVNVPVQALVPGTGGNIAAGALSVMTSAITGIDTVSNSAAFTNGFNQESDAQLKARFILYIQSLREATEAAIGYAIASLQVGMQWQIWENIDPNGSTDNGAFTVYVDDGSGAIPNATLTAAQTAVNSVRAAGVRYSALAATTLSANVTMTIVTAAGYNHSSAVAAVVAALGSYINGIGLGQVQNGSLVSGTLSYMKLGSIAFTVPGVTDVLSYTINSSSADLVPARGQTIKAGTLVVS